MKDIQGGKGGNKNPAFKIPLSQKTIHLTCESVQFPTKFIIGFCLNDHTENKAAILPSRVELYGGSDKSLSKISELIPIEDQFYLSHGIKLYGVNLNSSQYQGINSLKKVEFRLHEPYLASAS